jgi:TolB-like protein
MGRRLAGEQGFSVSFFRELKRRNVFRVGIAYVLAAWVLLQIVDFSLEVIAAPDWILQVFVLAAAVGLPVFLVFAWVFEMTPEGIKRESEIDRSQSITPHTGRKLDRAIIVFLALAVVFLLVDKFFQPGQPDPGSGVTQPAPKVDSSAAVELETPEKPSEDSNGRSVAVLPFVNMSADKDQEYFSDGISEELLNVLVRVEGLRVPSRTSSFTFKGSDKKVTEIGRELNVDHVLEGSVRKSGNRIRVTAQLIDVNTDSHLWSETYTRELDDIFIVQDEIAQAIVGALKVTLSGEEQQSIASHSTINVEAYNKYLLGRYLWNQRDIESLQAGIEPLREAVEIDPDYDQAWAALADSYVLIPEYTIGQVDGSNADIIAENVTKAREAADKALAINPDSARALTARAYGRFVYGYDFEGAEADFKRALELEPSYATARQWYGEMLAAMRRTDEALEQLDIAARLDPKSVIITHVKGWILLGAGRYAEAEKQYAIALPMGPESGIILSNMEILYLLTGQYERAKRFAMRAGDALGYDPAVSILIADALQNPELLPRAVEAVLGMDELPEGSLWKGLYLMILDQRELALSSLETGFEAGDPYAVHMNRVVLYDVLRDNPRFQALLARMNLWP